MTAAIILFCLGIITLIWLDIFTSRIRKPYRDDLTFEEFEKHWGDG